MIVNTGICDKYNYVAHLSLSSNLDLDFATTLFTGKVKYSVVFLFLYLTPQSGKSSEELKNWTDSYYNKQTNSETDPSCVYLNLNLVIKFASKN